MDIFSPLEWLANTITFSWLRTPPGTYLGDAIYFFIFDIFKIGILLISINYLMAITRYYFPMEKVRDLLTKRRWFGLDYLLAAFLGVISPFCSCSSIPLFIGFVGAGIPLGVTFAFLISSPLVNESSLYIFPVMFGMKVTVIYNLMGVGVAVVGGIIIQKLKLDRFVKSDILKFKSRQQFEAESGTGYIRFKDLILYWWKDGMQITRQIFPYVVLGVGIGALIHGFVPANVVERYLSSRSWWSVPLATVLGIPLYANSVSVIPVMEALVDKGVPLGTALAFMTGIVALSVPEGLILKRVIRWQLLAIFFGITTLGIVLMGYLFNWIM